jgi:ATP-dependent Clp protease adaptor protein ClpS
MDVGARRIDRRAGQAADFRVGDSGRVSINGRVTIVGAALMSGGAPDDDDAVETGVSTKTRPKTKKPSMYRVLLLNDDYTPMEFVVEILEVVFNKSHEDAVMIMLHVHQHGVGVCGVFTYEVAETKVAQVLDAARRNQHPLQCTMEKE